MEKKSNSEKNKDRVQARTLSFLFIFVYKYNSFALKTRQMKENTCASALNLTKEKGKK